MPALDLTSARWSLKGGLRRLVLTFGVVACATAPVAARADVIAYKLDMTAEVSNYSNAQHGDFVTFKGDFTFDTTAGYVTAASIIATGNLDHSNLGAGVLLNQVMTDFENDRVIALQNGATFYAQFQFVDSLALGKYTAGANVPDSPVGGNRFYSPNDGNYHIGYYGVTGGATPVPEPASLLVLGSAVIGFGVSRRAFGANKPAV